MNHILNGVTLRMKQPGGRLEYAVISTIVLVNCASWMAEFHTRVQSSPMSPWAFALSHRLLTIEAMLLFPFWPATIWRRLLSIGVTRGLAVLIVTTLPFLWLIGLSVTGDSFSPLVVFVLLQSPLALCAERQASKQHKGDTA
jgi:hypothetical protein